MTRTQRILSLLWPAFLIAGVQEALVFVVVDPRTLHWFGSTPIEWSMQAIYTVTFLIFWGTTSLACALVELLREGSVAQAPSAPERGSRSWAP